MSLLNPNSKATRHLIHRLITEPAKRVEAVGFRCEVVSIDDGKATLQFSIVDKDGKTLVDFLGLQELKAGDNLTIFNFSRFFDVNVSV